MRPADHDAAGFGPYEVARWRAALAHQPWREVLAHAPTLRRDGRYAAIADPRAAALLALLDVAPGTRGLIVGDRWGQLAVPLARRAAVTVLGRWPAALALLRDIGVQEGVDLAVCAGRLADAPLAAARFDLVLLHAGLGDAATDRGPMALAAAARLLAPGGMLVLATPNDAPAATDGEAAPLEANAVQADAPQADARNDLTHWHAAFAAAGLTAAAVYACFPDHQAPSHLVALPLLADFLASWDAPDVARTTRPPGYAFFLRAGATP